MFSWKRIASVTFVAVIALLFSFLVLLPAVLAMVDGSYDPTSYSVDGYCGGRAASVMCTKSRVNLFWIAVRDRFGSIIPKASPSNESGCAMAMEYKLCN